jgi:hypothetical protein
VPLTTLSFAAGDTSKPITVVVNGDLLDEANETFLVDLSNAVNATIADNQGQGTITDNEGIPSLSIDDVTVTEGDSGTVNATFTVTLSAASSQAVTVDYAPERLYLRAPDHIELCCWRHQQADYGGG